jgi:threonine synthase
MEAASVRYVSTRGAAPALAFEEVLLVGLARDGGLYVPERWPQFSRDEWARLGGLDYPKLAARIMAPFVDGALSEALLEALTREAYASFSHRAVTPLVQLDANDWLLELFHGPTLAFKDLAMQVLSRLMDHLLAKTQRSLTLVGATSGDTGSAAIEAFRGRARIDIFVLHPKGRISELQRRQMTTVADANVHNIALEGTFDDAQAIVKALFNDHEFRDRVGLSGVNSMNWARIAAQIPYYAWAALALGAPERSIAFSVPTGNFGDVFAGYVAKQMGLPIARLVIATNVNDILVRCLSTGAYARASVQATQSPSMDIQVASNFERLLFDIHGRDAKEVARLMGSLEREGKFSLSENALAPMRKTFDAARVDEEETTETIAKVHRETGLFIDPHTAVGVAAGAKIRPSRDVPLVCLATAHAGKFPEALRKATGADMPLPKRLVELASKPERMSVLPNDVAKVRAFIEERRSQP